MVWESAGDLTVQSAGDLPVQSAGDLPVWFVGWRLRIENAYEWNATSSSFKKYTSHEV